MKIGPPPDSTFPNIWEWVIYMLLDHYAYVNDALMYDAYIHDPWDLTMLHVCVMHISMMRQFCHGRTDGRTNGDPDTRVYDACIHDEAYLSCMYKPRLWCIYTLCMYVLCIYICSLIMYARCIYICSLIMMHMCMMHTSVIFNPWVCCVCVWCDSRSRKSSYNKFKIDICCLLSSWDRRLPYSAMFRVTLTTINT